jgi:erythromycin esterase
MLDDSTAASTHNPAVLEREVAAGHYSLQEECGHRAIGVVYRPEREAIGNYVPTIVPRHYNVLLCLDQTTALHPLHITPGAAPRPPDTYPWGP